MRRSEERILTTHVGSLPRDAGAVGPADPRRAGRGGRSRRAGAARRKAVRHVVERQTASGVDVINDGEQPRVGFQTYVAQRMKGFGGEFKRPRSRDCDGLPGSSPSSWPRACRAAAR